MAAMKARAMSEEGKPTQVSESALFLRGSILSYETGAGVEGGIMLSLNMSSDSVLGTNG